MIISTCWYLIILLNIWVSIKDLKLCNWQTYETVNNSRYIFRNYLKFCYHCFYSCVPMNNYFFTCILRFKRMLGCLLRFLYWVDVWNMASYMAVYGCKNFSILIKYFINRFTISYHQPDYKILIPFYHLTLLEYNIKVLYNFTISGLAQRWLCVKLDDFFRIY